MKANEIEDGKVLMIGDFVIGCIETDIVGEATYKILCKVTDINHYGDVRCEALKPFPNELDWQDGDDFSWIEPIPLTSEILERNGMHLYNRKTNSLMEECNHSDIFEEDDDYRVELSLDYDGSIRWTINGDEYTIMPLDYVHQLQHALRLCGIEKTIEL